MLSRVAKIALTAAVLIVLIVLVGCGDDTSPAKVDEPLEVTLENAGRFPVGIDVQHSPDAVRAIVYGPSGSDYSWVYDTTVSTLGNSVTIVEFGAYCRSGDQWTLCPGGYGRRTAAAFARFYASPGALLVPGEAYTDKMNRSGSASLHPWCVRWVFVGRDAEGGGVRGEATVELLGECPEEELGQPDLSGITFTADICECAAYSHCYAVELLASPLARLRWYDQNSGVVVHTYAETVVALSGSDQWVIQRLLADWPSYETCYDFAPPYMWPYTFARLCRSTPGGADSIFIATLDRPTDPPVPERLHEGIQDVGRLFWRNLCLPESSRAR